MVRSKVFYLRLFERLSFSLSMTGKRAARAEPLSLNGVNAAVKSPGLNPPIITSEWWIIGAKRGDADTVPGVAGVSGMIAM